MARDHVEYLIAQEMPRTPLMNKGFATGFRVAELSRDHDTGAVSYFSSLAPQWIRRESGYYEHDVELLVMTGDLRIGDTVLEAGHYSFIPGGCLCGVSPSRMRVVSCS